MQSCDQTCQHCARVWFKWLKSREHQMNMPHDGGTFALEALTSVRPPRPSVGAAVRVKSLVYSHTATVLRNSGQMAGDGVYRVYVAIVTRGRVWNVHVQREDLEEEVLTLPVE